MLEAYSLNVAVEANTAIPFNNIHLQKGCTAVLRSPATIVLNKCGVYMVAFNASATASETVQLYRDNVAQPQAQSTGLNPSFTTLVQVERSNNPNCPCSSPVTLQVIAEVATTLSDANIVITKVS